MADLTPTINLAADTSGSADPRGVSVDPNQLVPGLSNQPVRFAGPTALPAPTAAPAGNAMGQVGDLAGTINAMNQNRLFQQTFAARQKMGSILANSPDPESGWNTIMKDPQVAPFAGEALNSWRSAQLAQTQQQGEQQTQAFSALDAVKKGLPALAASPDQATWDSITKPVLAGASPSARKNLAPALDSLKSSLLDGLPDDQAARTKQFQSRVAGLGAASPDVWSLMFGKPGTVDAGSHIIPGRTDMTTGAFTPSGAPIAKGLAPTVVHGVGPEGQDTTTVWGGGNGLGGGGSSAGTPHVSASLPGRAASPGNALIGPTQTESQYNNKRTDDIADYEKSLDDRVGNGATLRKNIDTTIQAASQAQMGGGAEAYTKLGSALQAIGVKNPTVDKWANGSLAASQVIDKVALQNSMSQLKQQLTGVGGSRLNAQEFVAYLNKNPNLTTDPRAASEIFNLWNQFYDRDKLEQKSFNAFKQGKPTGDKTLDSLANDNALSGGKPDIKNWPALWNQSDFMGKFAPGGTIDTSHVKGNQPAGQVTHRYNPATKKIESVGP